MRLPIWPCQTVKMTHEDSYVDNTTGVIQASSRVALLGGGGTAPGTCYAVRLGAQDVTNLVGINEVFVNWVRFEFNGVGVTGGVGESHGFMVPGILPYDLALEGANLAGPPAAYHLWSNYDDIRGWPLNRGKRYYYCYTGDPGNSGNRVRMVYTYRPKKVLILNRTQALYMTIQNSYGQGLEGIASIVASFKKGD